MEPVKISETRRALLAGDFLALPLQPIHGLYVHVPFCLLKCAYCDFYSEPGMGAAVMEDYVAATLAEARAWRPFLERSNSIVSTVFLGGGTPTALQAPLMERLLKGLRSAVPIASDAEWTVEANPATIGGDYCGMLLESGVNRLSIGAQSMHDHELRELDRIHDAQQVRQTVNEAAAAGFRRISLDLMYGLPGQTTDTWQCTLEESLKLGIRHISCYCLTIEPGTRLWHEVQQGRAAKADEMAERELMRFTRAWLADRGMPAYEISNYAVPGEECRHNLMYWRSGNYIGLGPAAASHISGIRWRNSPDVRSFLKAAKDGSPAPITDVESLTPAQRAIELTMLMLRTREGLTWQRLNEIAGQRAQEEMEKTSLSKLNLLGLLSISSEGVKLTDQGVFVADHVISELVRGLD